MQTEVTAIFEEYNKAKSYKETLGEKGLYEQSRINARFYGGNQWYGVNSGNDRPLVRHNIIKRIGDFKMSQTMSSDIDIEFFAQGITGKRDITESYKNLKAKAQKGNFAFEGEVAESEIFAVCRALSKHYGLTAKRCDLQTLSARVLRDAYICGAGVLYTYFDADNLSSTGLDGERAKGDISCEVLNINDVYFADGTLPDIQSQPYIILASLKNKEELLKSAEGYGTAAAVEQSEVDDNGKILTLTKLYKDYQNGNPQVKCTVVAGGGTIRPVFDTKLHLYPLSVFRFGENESAAYGESEITYLIPNQIAINRMITAGVWSNIAAGMPMMIVNGDTVSGDITNDPGQIIKIYGTNEDVESAVKFVCPPDVTGWQNEAVDKLISNTLTQSGAGPAALGDERAQNASAIEKLQAAALIPMTILKSRYREFLRATALIWADFWFNLYSKRSLRIEDEDGVWFFPFDANRYSDIYISASAEIRDKKSFTPEEKIEMLGSLFDRGIITKRQYLARIPEALIDYRYELLEELKEETDETE